VPIERRGRGRPKGSRNKERNPVPQRHSERIAQQEQSDEQFVTGIDVAEIFTTAKEKADWELVLTLRRDGKITTAGAPFQESTRVEIESLMAGGVFNIVQWDPAKHTGKRIFNSRIVNEVKGKTTQHPYEKSRLVIQAYNDEGKAMILTQSPTIQRISQRLLLAFGPALMKKKGAVIWLRDITQAYVQSTTLLNRLILANLPKELQHLYPQNTLMEVKKPLYGIPEAGNHWWATYHKHHIERLGMEASTYDPCLLITKTENKDTDMFGIIGIQTDDTLGLSTEKFVNLEEE